MQKKIFLFIRLLVGRQSVFLGLCFVQPLYAALPHHPAASTHHPHHVGPNTLSGQAACSVHCTPPDPNRSPLQEPAGDMYIGAFNLACNQLPHQYATLHADTYECVGSHCVAHCTLNALQLAIQAACAPAQPPAQPPVHLAAITPDFLNIRDLRCILELPHGDAAPSDEDITPQGSPHKQPTR